MPGSSDSVKVAVRVRPFNQREKNAGSNCVISMNGNTTSIKNPETGDVKNFSFDHSYWSHDGFQDNNGIFQPETSSSNYADQRRVYNDLGQGVLDNAWQGYNAALFAYGQTGSGKSYSMIGYGPNKGIVPILCEELFKAIDENTDKGKQLQVSFSMLEIYNEQVRDLLVKAKQQAGGLKIRQNPKSGFYVEGLKQMPVRDYKEIEKLMEQGTVNRTTASTNMNATSSRSHMVITIRFAQVFKNADGQSNTRSSDINLVDLAGSERADSTGATGDRLKEGSAINQSLSSLGNVISALADIAMGKKKVIVPYRDSVLTKLLQSALGGNSRTIMIAALSPAAINYEETVSTLRYADRAKKIQNKAVVNESPTERLIRELKEENAKLMAMLQKGSKSAGSDTVEELQRMLEENERKMKDMDLSWEQRLEEARKEWEKSFSKSSDDSKQEECQKLPYITNINEDPQLSGIIKSPLPEGKTTLGKGGPSEVNIQIRGLGIQLKHAVLHNNRKEMFIEPVGKSQIFVSGHRIKEKTKLQNLDRIKLGSTSLFLYIGPPSERSAMDQVEKFNYDFFMMELAEHEGVAVDLHTPRAHESVDNSSTVRAFQEYVDLMPLVAEANTISEELGKGVHFDAEIKSDASHDPKGIATGREVLVRVTNKNTKKLWIWTHSKFLHRKDLMDELYWKFVDDGGSKKPNVEKEKDPFWDPVEDIFLGSCHVMLQCLSYCMEIDEHFALHNYHGKEEAVIHVQILPCDAMGNLLDDEDIVEPSELIGKPFHVTFRLPQYMGVRWTKEDRSRGVYCRYSFYKQSATTVKIVGKSSAELDYKKDFAFPRVTQEFLEYLQTHSVVLELWGTQVDAVGHALSNGHANGTSYPYDEEVSKLKHREQYLSEECNDLKKENFRLKQSLDRQKQAIALTKNKRGSVDIDRKSSIDASPQHTAVGLDVDLAKALKSFFKDVRGVQQQLRNIKQNVSEAKHGSGQNGNIKSALEMQEKYIQDVDEQLATCVQSLKQTVASTLKKSKS